MTEYDVEQEFSNVYKAIGEVGDRAGRNFEALQDIGKKLSGVENQIKKLGAASFGVGGSEGGSGGSYVDDLAEAPYFMQTKWNELKDYDEIPTSMHTGKILEANLFDTFTDFFIPEAIGAVQSLSGKVDLSGVGKKYDELMEAFNEDMQYTLEEVENLFHEGWEFGKNIADDEIEAIYENARQEAVC